jgi:hypothetical protein
VTRLGPLRAGLLLLSALAAGGCTQVMRYADTLVDDESGRTPFTRVPATVGGTVGFVVGLPVDVVVFPATLAYYHAQPKETREVLSTFLFPSFVLWKVGMLVGAPFDLVEWGVWRRWQPERALSREERDAIERTWDQREYSEYPVTPIYPPPAPDGA